MYWDHKYYKHSGMIGFMGILCLVFLGVPATVFLSIIYSYAIFYIPFVYINLFLTIGCGAAVGYMVSKCAKLGKIRNNTFLLITGFGFGLLSEYVGWVSWLFALSEQKYIILSPGTILEIMADLSKEGVWSIHGTTPQGIFLYLVWAVEAVLILGFSTFMVWHLLGTKAFCERCGVWVKGNDSISLLEPIANPGECKLQLEQGDYTTLESLKKVEVSSDHFTVIELYHCSGCNALFLLTVKDVKVKINSNGGEDLQEDLVVRNLIIDSQIYERLKNHWVNGYEENSESFPDEMEEQPLSDVPSNE